MDAIKRGVMLGALLLFFGGCSSEQLPLSEPERYDLTLCLETTAGGTAAEAAALFAEKVEALSDGRMTVGIVEVDEGALALDGMVTGSYDLFLITNGTASEGIVDYTYFTSPYYFGDYEHMSLALNSDRLGTIMNARTRAALRVEPMTALYGGSRVFIHAAASFPITSIADFEEQTPTLIPTPGGIMEDMLKSNETPADISGIEQILYDFERRRVQLFDFYKRDFDRLVFHERFDTVYLIDDFHVVDINWLMINAETGDSLDGYQMAVLREAAAYALAWNDTTVTEWEEQMMTSFTDRFGKGSVLTEAAMAEEILAHIRMSVRYANLWNWDTYDMIREIAA